MALLLVVGIDDDKNNIKMKYNNDDKWIKWYVKYSKYNKINNNATNTLN